MRTLIIVDMLNDFVHPDGSLYFPEGKEIIPNVSSILNMYQKYDDTIIFICDNHYENDKEFKRFPKHAVKGTWGAEIIDELIYKLESPYHVIPKTRYSGFYNTYLESHIIGSEIIEVCGVCTSICVMDTVGGLANRDYNVYIDSRAVADFDNSMHDFALERMRNLYGVRIV